jgi:putative ABC transport system permease protein
VFRATVKNLLAHKLRLALTAVSVVLGVSFMAGTYVLTDTINHTFDTLFAQTAKGKDIEVRAKTPIPTAGKNAAQVQRPTVPDALVAQVRQMPGVKLAQGSVQGFAQLIGKDGKPVGGKAPTFGANWLTDSQLSSFTVRQGAGPITDDQVAVDNKTFKDQGFHLGDRLTVLTAAAPRQFTLVGALGFGTADNLGGATFAVFDGPTAQSLMNKSGRWDSIQVAAKPGISATKLAQQVGQALPPGYEAVTAQAVANDLAKSVESSLSFFKTFLLIFAIIALFVGAFIIYNTFSILVTQRTRELALFRALGASRRQVNRSVISEAGIVGVFASVVGLGAGVLLAIAMKALFGVLGFTLPSSSTVLLPRTIIISIIVGTVVTLVSSIVPARRASRVAPVAAMSETPSATAASMRKRITGGAVVGGIGLVVLFAGLFAHGGNTLGKVGAGAGLTFIGVAMLSPLVTGPMALVLGAPFAFLGHMTGKLSQQNAMRNPRRTASTAAALMVGVALVTVMATLGATLKATFSKIIDDSVKADYVVEPTGGLGGGGFTPVVAQQLASRPELAAAAGGRQAMWHNGTTLKQLVAVDAGPANQVINFDMKSGTESALANGGVLVDSKEAKSRHLQVGDPLEMGFDITGVQHLVVGGTYAPNDFLGKYVISMDTYNKNYPDHLLDLVFVKAKSSPPVALAAINGVIKPYPNLAAKDQTAFKAQQKDNVSKLLNLVYILLAFSILIALIGIVNTLALSVIERTRELGLLRAVGMKRRQVKRMVQGEAIVVCLIGALLGVVVGLGLGLALVAAIQINGTKVVVVPVGTLVLVLIMAGVAGVIAAIWPARRASKLDVLTAIATT